MVTPHEQRMKDDFKVFLFALWRHLGLPKPTPRQLAIADYLQNGPRRRVVEAFRGVGKSWITAAYVLWRLYCNPQKRILVISATKERADNFSTFCHRLLLEVPWLRSLAPRDGQRNSKISFDVGPAKADQAPSVKSVGINGQFTGSRADEIVADDVEVPNNALTQGMREKLWEAVKEFDAVLKPDGIITYLGTPQIIFSLYNELPNRGYEVRIWPAQYPDLEQIATYGDRLAPDILEVCKTKPDSIGQSTEPTRFSTQDLNERRVSYGISGYQLQFMLNTQLSDENRFPLKLKDLIIASVHPDEGPLKIIWSNEPERKVEELPCVGLPGDGFFRPLAYKDDHATQTAPYTGSVMFIDPAGRGKDETGYAVVKMLHGNLYVPRGGVGGMSGGYTPETLKALVEIAKTNKVKQVLIESNFGDGMFTELIKPVFVAEGYPCAVEEERSSGQKELRVIDTLEPVMNQHRLVIDPECVTQDYERTNLTQGLERAREYMLFHQMSYITKERGALGHDDRLEALAGAVRYWVDQMAANADKRQDEYRDRLLMQELKKFTHSIKGTIVVGTGRRPHRKHSTGILGGL